MALQENKKKLDTLAAEQKIPFTQGHTHTHRQKLKSCCFVALSLE